MLSEAQRADFERNGIVKLENVFAPEAAVAMRGVFWREVSNRYGVDRDDRATWDKHRPDGLRSTKKSSAFDPMFGPVLQDALDDLFGPGGWRPPKHMGQVLATMPNATQWRVPHKLWHSDFDAYGRNVALFAVKWWSFFDIVEPGQGGTPQLAGGHNAFRRFLETCENREYKHARDTFLRSQPWLRALINDEGDAGRNQEFMHEHDLDGLPVRVVELTGKPGDVFVTHPWVFHSIAVNACATPRLMRSGAIYATGTLPIASNRSPSPRS